MQDNHVDSILRLLETGDVSMNAHLDLIRNTQWQRYSVGPMSSWPSELATTIYLVMVASQPQCLIIGEENLLLYNRAYARMIRGLHPILGQPLDTVEEWREYQAKMAEHRQMAAVVPTYSTPPFVIPMMNQGRLENVHLQLDISMLPSPLQGYYMCFQETTDWVLRERRRSTVRELSEKWSSANDLSSLWPLVIQSLSDNPEDFPIAAIYSTRKAVDLNSLHEPGTEHKLYHFEGSVGDFDVDAWPLAFNSESTEPCLQPLVQAVSTKDQTITSKLPRSWSAGSLRRGTGDLCMEAAVLPSSLTRHQDVESLLVIGLPTRALLDEPQRQHINHLQREFADVVNNLVARTEAAYRKKEKARQNQLEKELLAKELALRQKEAEMATKMAEKVLTVIDEVEIGFFEYKSTGELVRANECYYQLSGYPRDCPPDTKHKFLDLIHPADVDLVSSSWQSMIEGQWRKFEIRYRNNTEEGQWALVACQPVRDSNGVVTSVIGAVTDISTQKRSEKIALDRAEALEKARALEERFQKAMEIAPFGCMIADTTKGVQYVNETWWELTQHTRVPLEQIDWNSVLYEEDLEIAEEGWQAMLRGEQVTYSLRLKRLYYGADGEPRGPVEVMVTALPECDDTGKVVKVLGFTLDVSPLKFEARVQRVRMEEALEARKNQEMFYDTISHEIRNPLSAVIHCADSTKDNLDEMRRLIENLARKAKDTSVIHEEVGLLLEHISSSDEAVDTIATCSDHQKRLISDILTLSKLDSQLLQINSSPVRALDLLQDVRKMFEVEAGREGIAMEFVTDASIHQFGVDQVNLDFGRILQVLINLVSNAIKFSKNEMGPRQIRLVMGASGNKRPLHLPVDFSFHNQDSIYETTSEGQDEFYLWFTVTDSGRGMSPEEKSRIFTRFAQGSRKTYSEYGGSGLGLFISRQLVELQGGEIGVSSELGQGSTFAFFVNAPPVERAIEVPFLAVTSNTCHRSKTDSVIQVSMTESPMPCQKTKLLVVEDNVVNQRVLRKQLIKHGYEVHVASNGQEAVDFLTSPTQEAQIDCILMDVEMPELDGLAATKQIREWERRSSFISNSSGSKSRPRLSRGSSFNSIRSNVSSHTEDSSQSRIPIIAISANARPEQKNDAILAGMDDSIAKPFRIADLIPRIDHLLDKHRKPSAARA